MTTRAAGPATGAPPAIRAAREVPLPRWLAYVWPAIALDGGAIERTWAAGAAGAVVAGLIRPVVAAAARFASAVEVAGRTASGSTLARDPAAGDRQSALPDAAAPAGGGLAYFVLLAALLAVLAYTIWTEFRSALRTHPR